MLQLEEKSSKEVAVNRSTKGNIPIKNELLNKYQNVRKIFDGEKNLVNYKIFIDYDLEISNTIDIKNIKIEDVKKLANDIFNLTHTKNIFINDNNKILVSKSGINESVEKICNNHNQRELLIEHLKVFSKLGNIIENAKLVSQVPEKKGRLKYVSWHYFVEGVIIDNIEYLLEFEVVSMNNGKNNYRIQRLERI